MRGFPSLLTLIVSVLVVANVVNASDKDEAGAVAKIRQLGGRVTRDGVGVSGPVIGVHFERSNSFNDSHLHLLKPLSNLRILDLGMTKVTDAGMKELRSHRNLTELHLTGTKVGNLGMKEIRSLTNLTILDLDRTEISDDGLTEIRTLRKLTTLKLCFTKVKDAGMTVFGELNSLHSLFLVSGGTILGASAFQTRNCFSVTMSHII